MQRGDGYTCIMYGYWVYVTIIVVVRVRNGHMQCDMGMGTEYWVPQKSGKFFLCNDALENERIHAHNLIQRKGYKKSARQH